MCNYIVHMRKSSSLTAEIVSIGNSKGVRIPKAIREQVGLEGRVTLSVADNALVIRPVQDPRTGWAARFAAAKPGASHDTAWLDPANEFDVTEWTW